MDANENPLISLASAQQLPRISVFLESFFEQRLLLRRSTDELGKLAENGFAAFEDDECVGFAAIEIYSRKLAEIQCLAVAETQRGRGLGRQLVERCVERARELGVMEVMAISSSDSFLQSCGFDYSLPDQKRALFYQLRPRD